ncbi:SDR family oxidoreductase [Endozoicomonas arenosclerae]|uniref:SDR family oxidoreductase n=1 Tax=Endozoicomonas arenosclerae TaxID=1633495 RepID=UPI0007839526|nr:sugar nucleotide-binding protein [Endozoicomonas arenosclerae]
MKVLVIGQTGQVGYEVCRILEEKGISWHAPDREELDLAEPEQIQTCLNRHQPDLVINAAAYNNPVKAENEPSRCFSINRDAVAELADCCQRQGIILFQLSSYRVFDGTKQEPYNEKDPTNPIGVLGNSRLQAEQQIRERCERHIILRLSWIISERRPNILRRLAEQMLVEKEVYVTPDQLGCPTPADDVARVIVAMVQQLDCGAESWGTYHYSTTESVSESNFAEVLIAEASQHKELKVRKLIMAKIDSREGIKPPANGTLSSNKVLNTFGVHARPWRSAVARIIREVYNVSKPSK